MNRLGRALLVALVVTACADDDDTVDTLDPLQDGESSTTSPAGDETLAGDASVPSSAPFEAAGDGIITIQVRLAATGLDETVMLDRATVPADQLDPISLYVSCPALDGTGEGGSYEVRVIDLRRLTSDSELVSAALLAEGPVEVPGQYDATLELSDVTQATTTYSGTMRLDPGMSAGTFDVVDERGNAATGTFSCTASPPATTTGTSTATAVASTPPDATTTASADVPSSAPTSDSSTTSVAIATTTVADTVSPPGT